MLFAGMNTLLAGMNSHVYRNENLYNGRLCSRNSEIKCLICLESRTCYFLRFLLNQGFGDNQIGLLICNALILVEKSFKK